MMDNKTASAVNAAKNILMSLDKHRLETPVQTEHLRWLLETLVELAAKPIENRIADSAHRHVLGAIVSVNEAQKARGF